MQFYDSVIIKKKKRRKTKGNKNKFWERNSVDGPRVMTSGYFGLVDRGAVEKKKICLSCGNCFLYPKGNRKRREKACCMLRSTWTKSTTRRNGRWFCFDPGGALQCLWQPSAFRLVMLEALRCVSHGWLTREKSTLMWRKKYKAGDKV